MDRRTLVTFTRVAVFVAGLGPFLAGIAVPPAFAADSEPDPMSSAEVRRQLSVAQGHIDNGQYRRAVSVLNELSQAEPKNADVHNLLGYSHRRMEDFSRAERYYTIALRHEPAHRGALEYAGEMYVQTERPDEAARMLARLEKACPQGCPELDQLRAVVAGEKKTW